MIASSTTPILLGQLPLPSLPLVVALLHLVNYAAFRLKHSVDLAVLVLGWTWGRGNSVDFILISSEALSGTDFVTLLHYSFRVF